MTDKGSNNLGVACSGAPALMSVWNELLVLSSLRSARNMQRLSSSIVRGLLILETLTGEPQPLTEIADGLGFNRSTTHRYLVTFGALGLVEQTMAREYKLAVRASAAGLNAIGIVRCGLPLADCVLRRLRDETGYTVSMGMLDGHRVIYIYRFFGHRRGQYAIDGGVGVGASIPVHCSALGKALLAGQSKSKRREILTGLELVRYGPKTITDENKLVAHIDRISLRPEIVSDEELARGSRSIAVLVCSRTECAIDVTVPKTAYTVDRLIKQVGPLLTRVAEEVGSARGYRF